MVAINFRRIVSAILKKNGGRVEEKILKFKRYTLKVGLRIIRDLINCTRLIGNPILAYGYLRSGCAPQIGRFMFAGLNFIGRKEDWVAIREVLVEDEYRCIEQLFGKNSRPLVLDLGANIGTFALRLFRHCPEARVISVEAADDTFHVLSANKNSNPALDWEILNYGVWKDDGVLTLMRRGGPAGHRVVDGIGDDVVNGISLPSLVQKYECDPIDLAKIDIEGGEEAVIPNSLEVLRRTRFLIIEIHNDRIDSKPVMQALNSIYRYCWQLNKRESVKPLYIMANEAIAFDEHIENICGC